MRIHAATAPRIARPTEQKYDWKGAVVRALKNDAGLDESAIPKKVLNAIGSWTDTTQTYSKAFIGKDVVYVHVDDMLADNNRDEGFIAANSKGKIVAQGSLNQDDRGNLLTNTIIFTKVAK